MIKKIDCTNMDCPGPVLKTKEALLESPNLLEIELNSFSSIENVKKFAKSQGYYYIIKEKNRDKTTLVLSKDKSLDRNDKPFYLLFIGSIISAFLAGTCCLAPLLFLIFGVSMSSLSFLSIFAPYQTLFSIIAVAILVYLWYGYFKRIKSGFACYSKLCKNYKLYLIIGTIIVIIFISYPVWANYIMEYL